MRSIGLITVVLAVLVSGGLVSSAQALTLNVASNGVDTGTCGAAATPCRTIGQAVDRAVEGDRILVGPGVYGDLDQDGVLGESGEETAGDPACSCMLQITKRLTLESTHGAAMTIIRGLTSLTAVSLEVSGIVFGARDRGFTITGVSIGLRTSDGADGVRVIGNVIVGTGTGPGGGLGLSINGDAVIQDNVVSDLMLGFIVDGTGYTLTGNAIVRTGVGINVLGGDGTVSGNAIIGNGTGVDVVFGDGLALMRNAILGNLNCGVRVRASFSSEPVVTQNNIYGNGPRHELRPRQPRRIARAGVAELLGRRERPWPGPR